MLSLKVGEKDTRRGFVRCVWIQDFEQAGELYRKVLSPDQKEALVSNIAAHLRNADREASLQRHCPQNPLFSVQFKEKPNPK